MSESTPKPDEPQPGVPMSKLVEWAGHFSTAIEALFAGRHSEAVRGFSEALSIVSEHYPTWGNLGAAYLAMDRREDALRCLHKALELNPSYKAPSDLLIKGIENAQSEIRGMAVLLSWASSMPWESRAL